MLFPKNCSYQKAWELDTNKGQIIALLQLDAEEDLRLECVASLSAAEESHIALFEI